MLSSKVSSLDHDWIRHHEGQWQRKVFINKLPVKTQYNGLPAWVQVSHLDSCTPERAQLLPVELVDSQQKLRVNSAYLFLIGPHLLPRPINQSLVMIEVWITPRLGAKPVLARLAVDTGCQLEGVLSTDFVQRWGWETVPSLTSIRTANGGVVSGVRHLRANTRFHPIFTHQVAYGVLDLPGFDGLLGAGFLQRFSPYSISVTNSQSKEVCFTVPQTKEVIKLQGITAELNSLVQSPPLTEPELETKPCLAIQWTPPTPEDLGNIMGQFGLGFDPITREAALEQISHNDQLPEAEWGYGVLDRVLTPEAAEGLVFLATHDNTRDNCLKHVPASHQLQLQELLQKYKATVFQECEFPPFPPPREVEFSIQLEPGAQVPTAPVHKLSPALVNQLREMIQELLHNGLIVPTNSPYAAPLLLVKKPEVYIIFVLITDG